MRSFAIIALAAGANAAYIEYSSSAVVPAYSAASSSAEYEASSAPAYAAYSSAKYEESSSAPAYAASTPVYSASYPGYETSSAPAYPVASSSPVYQEYPITSTKVVPETTFVCPTPTVM